MTDYERIILEEIGSTNDYAKARRGEGKNLVITAKRQSGGRGTKGRSFSSNEGGVYLTKLTFYEDFPASQAFKIMVNGAVAVCETLRFYGVQPTIKWANDIFVKGKKICGILIENTFFGARISSSVVGLGLNVSNDLPSELFEVATTLSLEMENPPAVEEITERLIGNLAKEWTIEDYRKHLGFIGQEVDLLFGEECKRAVLLGVEEDGRLLVKMDGERLVFSSAEVSIRG